jgi:hypothetical protein
LTDRSYTTSIDGSHIVVELDAGDLNELKRASALARDKASSYASFTEHFVADLVENPIVPMCALEARNYVEDSTPPEVDSFSIDLTQQPATLTFAFSETIRASSANTSALQLQSARNAAVAAETYRLTGGVVASYDSTEIVIVVTKFDLDAIKALSVLATGPDSTFITVGTTAFQDMNNNTVIAVPADDALPTVEFLADLTQPELESCTLDMDAGTISLLFSETVNGSSMDMTGFALQNAENTAVASNLETMRLTGGEATEGFSTSVNMSISYSDMNDIKGLAHLATNTSNVFCTLAADSILDMNFLGNVEVGAGHAIEESAFVADTTPPSLEHFDLDMDNGVVIFSFSETINPKTFLPTKVTFTNISCDDCEGFLLTGSHQVSYSLETPQWLELTLLKDDIDELKRLGFLATDISDTYLAIDEAGILDMAGNYIRSRTSMIANAFQPDETDPELVNAIFDGNLGRLTLSFSETVLMSSLQINSVAITEPGESDVFFLTGGSFPTHRALEVTVQLTDFDQDVMKKLTNIATERSKTVVSLQQGAIFDTSRNQLAAVKRPVDTFVADTTAPVLVWWKLDVDAFELKLSFSETVESSSLVHEALVLQGIKYAVIPDMEWGTEPEPEPEPGSEPAPEPAPEPEPLGAASNAEYFRLTPTSSVPIQDDGNVLSVTISRDDMNVIKQLENLAVSTETSWLSFDSVLVKDMANNAVEAVNAFGGRQAEDYAADATRPSLESVSLSMDGEQAQLVFSFSETMELSTFTPGAGGFQLDLSYAKDGMYTEMTSEHLTTFTFSTSQVNSPVITAGLATADVNALKTVSLSVLSEAKFRFVGSSGGEGLPQDMTGLASEVAVLPVTILARDSVSPKLVDFTLDMSSHTATLTFDEPVDASGTGDATYLTFVGVDDRVPLTSSSVFTGVGTVVSLQIDVVDIDTIKLSRGTASSESNTRLELAAGAIKDTAGNTLGLTNKAVASDGYTADGVAPNLVRYAVNMNASTLTLNFDEPMESDSLTPEAFKLVSNTGTSVASYTLTDGATASSDGRQLVLVMTTVDTNNIKLDESLYTSISTAYLKFDASAATDMAGNQVVALDDITAKQAEGFIDDTTVPGIRSFDLDMDSEELTLYFYETMDASTLQITALVLQRSSNTGVNPTSEFEDLAATHRLTESTFDPSADGTSITIVLARADIDEIKRKEIARTSSTAWLAADAAAIYDMHNNPSFALTDGLDALGVSTFAADRSAPTLQYFDLSMNEASMLFYFSETVRVSTLDVTEVLLQLDAGHGGYQEYRLSGASNVVSTDHSAIEVTIDVADMNALKQRDLLATSPSTTLVSFGSALIKDMNFNPVDAISQASAKPVHRLYEDITKPALAEFELDMSGDVAQITLSFTETVDASSLNFTSIVLLSAAAEPRQQYRLTGGSATTVDDTSIVVDVTHDDLNSIKELLELATAPSSTYISFDRKLIADMAGNLILPERDASPFLATGYAADVTPPVLLTFGLNLTSEVLTMSFSESVEAQSLQPSRMTIQNQACPDGSGLVSTVLTEYTVLSGNGPVVEVLLHLEDLNELKAKTSLATSTDDTIIYLAASAVRDLAASPNDIVGFTGCSGLPASNFGSDTIAPVLTDFTLDMANEELHLSFSETVDAASLVIQELILTSVAGSSGEPEPEPQPEPQSEPEPEPESGHISTFTLTDAGVRRFSHMIVVVELRASDLNLIKLTDEIAKAKASSNLLFDSALIMDMAENSVESTLITPFAADRFYPDTIAPRLERVDLDLTVGEIVATFSEAVRLSTFQSSAIVLHGGDGAGAPSVRLSTSLEFTSASSDGTILTTELSTADLNQLKLSSTLAVSRLTTRVSATSDAIRDMQGNAVVGISEDGDELYVEEYTSDGRPPELKRFDIDLTTEQLSLSFSEAVSAASLSYSGITIQDGLQAYRSDPAADPDYAYTLTGGCVVSEDGPVVVLNLTTRDLDNLKRLEGVATDSTNTYAIITTGTVLDLNGNEVTAVLDGDAMRVSSFTRDNTAPVLLSYEFVMSDTGPPLRLRLKFSETVDAEAFDLTKVVLQDAAGSAPTNSVRLTDGSVRTLRASWDDVPCDGP